MLKSPRGQWVNVACCQESNSLWLRWNHWGSVTHMHQWTGSSLIHIMAWCLVGTRPIPEPVLNYFHWLYLRTFCWHFQIRFLVKVTLWFECSLGSNWYKSVLVQVMAWHQSGAKPLPKPMLTQFIMHMCATKTHWVKKSVLNTACNIKSCLQFWHGDQRQRADASRAWYLFSTSRPRSILRLPHDQVLESDQVIWVSCTVWYCCNMVIFYQNTHKKYCIAHHKRWAIGFILWVQSCCQTSSMRHTKSPNRNVSSLILQLSCSCLGTIHWSQVLSREWRCSWSSASQRWSIYIWAINNFIAYWGVAYIRDLMVYLWQHHIIS